ERANWTCEECGKPCRRTGEDLLSFIVRVRGPRISECRLAAEIMEAPGRFVLTVAHLDHDPENPNARLKALCAPCHCRYDISPQQMARKRFAKRERLGQLNLLEDAP
ncbi:MAG: HNH endonuclease, partial [Cyanobacteria bacterium P01_F01_bin.150]